MSDQPEHELRVPIVFEDDSADGPFYVAGQMSVNFDEDDFYLRFYQVVPPVPSSDGDVPSVVSASLVAKVAIPVGRMPSIIRALTENARRFEMRTGIVLDWEGVDSGDNS